MVGIRIQIGEQYEGGYGLNEGIEICNALIANGMVDYLNANVGEVATCVLYECVSKRDFIAFSV